MAKSPSNYKELFQKTWLVASLTMVATGILNGVLSLQDPLRLHRAGLAMVNTQDNQSNTDETDDIVRLLDMVWLHVVSVQLGLHCDPSDWIDITSRFAPCHCTVLVH